MAGKIGDKTKMQLAKEAIKEFAESLPEEANISLRVYGHKGSNADGDRQLSCSSSDLVYPLQSYEPKRLDQALALFEPTGWTSIAHSLKLAQQDLAAFSADKNTNVIYLVSDGIETCGGDPVAVAKELSQSQIMPLLNVIGFDVNAEGQKQLKAIAQASEGLYANVTNREQFKESWSGQRNRPEVGAVEAGRPDGSRRGADRPPQVDRRLQPGLVRQKLAGEPEPRDCNRVFGGKRQDRQSGQGVFYEAKTGQGNVSRTIERGAYRLFGEPDQQDVSGNERRNRGKIQWWLVGKSRCARQCV